MISIEKLDYVASHSKDIRKVGCILEPLEEFQKLMKDLIKHPIIYQCVMKIIILMIM